MEELARARIVERIFRRDHTVWRPEPDKISNRLGWLDAPLEMIEAVPALKLFVDGVRADDYAQVVLLGMGGSSLAPGVFRKTFGVADGYLELTVLDSTDPRAVLTLAKRLDPRSTLFIVATKSGGTVETLSFYKFFYNWVMDAVGADKAGDHFVAITDPGSKLEEIAKRRKFRKVLLNNTNIGGRYSALSYFGLAPAALLGVDLEELLRRSQQAVAACSPEMPAQGNPGAELGTILGELAKAGRDKLTLVASPTLVSFGDWVEQLIAESTGKDGKGVTPVVGETLGTPSMYGDDRLFVAMQLAGEQIDEGALQQLERAGHPAVRLQLEDKYDLGAQYFIWEFATAVAGQRLGIQPFDQPNVEAAKRLARQMVEAYRKQGVLPDGEYKRTDAEELIVFLKAAQTGDYVALQAYVPPNEQTTNSLQKLRSAIGARYKVATTIGYGPRYLHSTGQLHKGDGGNGLFVQLVSSALQDAPIPDQAGSKASSISFEVLKQAQALGDALALRETKRRVIAFKLGDDPISEIDRLAEGMR